MHIHVVRAGQTLYAIGQEYGIAPALIARYNGLREPYRLAVGQALLILQPLLTYRVRTGDTLFSIAARFGVTVHTLWRNNPNLSGGTTIYPDQTLVIRLEQAATRPALVSGYAYPYVTQRTLRGILPYASWLIPFTYGITSTGDLVAAEDAALLRLAQAYGVSPLLHLSTLGEEGTFSAARAAEVLQSEEKTQRLIARVTAQLSARGYAGVDVDFEFLGAELREAYAAFLAQLRTAVNAAGGVLLAALAPKTSAQQSGALYEGHDYAAIGRAADLVLLMTYEWGYTYGPPMAVAPIGSVRRVLDYAVQELAPEKILLGFPNYAYDWTLPYQRGQTRAVSLGNEAAAELAVQVGAEIRFDQTAQTPYFVYTAPDGLVHEVWFEDARSALAKLRLVEEYGFAGVGIWNFMRPFTAGFSLLDYLFSIPQPPVSA